MNVEQARELEAAYLMNLYPPIRFPIVVDRGEGAFVWDTEGRQYLDLISGGRAVTGLGHCHPRVTAAIQRQAARLIHMSNDFFTEPQLELARLLVEISCCDKVFLCNGGAEANEAAIKLARKWQKVNGAPDKTEI